MTNEGQKSQNHRSTEQPSARNNRRFRLAEIFAEANPTASNASNTQNRSASDTTQGEKRSGSGTKNMTEAGRAQRRLDERASALGVKLPPVANQDIIATANRVYDTTPRASVLRVESETLSAAEASAEREGQSDASSPTGFGSLLARSRARRDAAHDPRTRERAARNAAERSAAMNAAMNDELLEEKTVGKSGGKGVGKFSPSRFLTGNFSPNTLAPNQTLTWNEESEETMESTHEGFSPSPRDGRNVQPRPTTQHGQTPDTRANAMNTHSDNESVLYSELEQLRGGMEEMYRVMTEMQERGDAQDKVFNTLHAELQDYKNDFIYEHMKPVVRPLLFLFDHMEQFENELGTQRNPTPTPGVERRLLSPELMCENISFFREQLVEALRICEVTPMKRPEGEVDSRLHKVVDTVPTDAAGHNVIQRVVRSGWYLNGRVFRPAEVIIGLSRQ